MADKENKMSLRQRVGSFISGDRGAFRSPPGPPSAPEEKKSTGAERRKSPKMSYGSHGASTTLNSLIGWILDPGSAEDNIDLFSSTLRQRARDLFSGGGLGRSGPQTLNVATTGWGIIPKPKIDSEFLGLTDEQAEEIERAILREFKLWAESEMCDAERQKDFYDMQQLAFLSMLMSGDVFCLFGMKPNKRTPYQTTVRLLEADRISTPDSSGDSTSKATDSGGRIIDGVEINQEGEVIRYYISSRSPLSQNDNTELTWQPIDAFGPDSGYPNILHIMTWERPEQRRGIPFVASEIEGLKQFDRYMNAELAAQVVSAMLTTFITSNEDDGKPGMEDAISDEEKVTDDELHLELAPGAIYDLPAGKHVETVNPLRNNTAFESFVNTQFMVRGSGLGIPKEVLLKKYETNYTAARAALLDFNRTVKVFRSRFDRHFNQPIYEQVLAEAVASGRINAPGFFDDPLVRKAWSGCKWIGATMGHVDPLKEINAAAARIANNITTQEQEAAEYNGNDWTENVRQRRKEISELADMQELVNRIQQQAAANAQAALKEEEDE